MMKKKLVAAIMDVEVLFSNLSGNTLKQQQNRCSYIDGFLFQRISLETVDVRCFKGDSGKPPAGLRGCGKVLPA